MSRVFCVLAALLLSACAGTAPPVRYHTLVAAPEPAASASARRAWQLLPVTVPAQVDRPQWVMRAADGTMAVLEQERWIAPLNEELASALTDAITRRLGPPSLGNDAWRVRVDVQRFDLLPGRGARLDAVWAVQAPGGTALALSCARAIEQPAGGGYPALAAAHRGAVAQLGRDIAAALSALAAGQAFGC